MDSEKQIEEMARISCDLCEYERSGKCTVNNSCGIGMCYMATHTARKLYNAGYRKQSEGEWILEHETYGEMICSVCGKECHTERKPDHYEDYQMTDFYITSPFCPNCGAKMKGE